MLVHFSSGFEMRFAILCVFASFFKACSILFTIESFLNFYFPYALLYTFSNYKRNEWEHFCLCFNFRRIFLFHSNENMASDNSQLYSSLSAAMQSFQSIRPMFDLNPLDNKTSSNLTLSLYTHIFGFEKLFESREDVDKTGVWMKSIWTYSFLFAFLYVVFVKVGVSYMSSRPRYELRGPLIVWNLFLAIFSILGAIRVWPEFFYAINK